MPDTSPVVQTQILVVQGPLCGNSSEKSAVLQRKKALAYRGKAGQNTGTAFSCLKVRGGSPPF